MSSFTSPLIVEIGQGEVNNRGYAKLYKSFTYEIGSLGSGNIIKIPKGFETDFTSIPRFAMPFIPILGKHAKAAVLHDWLWIHGDRKQAAKIMLEAMTVLQVPKIRKYVIYFAVYLRALLN